MINQSHRFHGYNSLRGVYSRGQSVRGDMVSLKFARPSSGNDSGRPYRVAVIVSRKVSKSAVVRNRIRRRIYEAVRKSDAGITSGIDLVFTVFSERLAELPAPKPQAIINELLQKAAAAQGVGVKTPVGRAIVKSKVQEISPGNKQGK